MSDVTGVKQVLVQTQAVERVQEAARRQGDIQQKTFAVTMDHQADLREHQVNEGQQTREEVLDPNARQEKEREKESEADGAKRRPQGPEEEPEPEDEERGRHIDARA